MLVSVSRLTRAGLMLRCAPIVLVPVLLAASTFPGQFHVSAIYWLLGCSSAVVFALGARWPVAASLVVSALAVPMLAAEAWGLSGLVPYLGALAVADVAAHSQRDRVVAGVALCWSLALLVGSFLDGPTHSWTAADAVTIVAAVGLPVLFGLYWRGQARLADTYRERAADAELRRVAAETAARSDERNAMARELHDIVAHHMAAIVLRIAVAEHVVGTADPRVTEVLNDVHHTATAALADIRRLQVALRDPGSNGVTMIEPDSMWAEIDAAVERARAAGFDVTPIIDRDLVGLDAIARLTVLRVTQEALTNVMKHAAADGPVELVITRRDGGVGIRVSSARSDTSEPTAAGHGTIGMTERLTLSGGRFAARTSGDTWVVDAWLPDTATAAPDAPQ